MKRTPVNALARKRIAEICERQLLTRCELKLPGCWGEAHGAAHRHKRRWYYDQPDETLWDQRQWVAACSVCHQTIEKDAALTEALFLKLRGNK